MRTSAVCTMKPSAADAGAGSGVVRFFWLMSNTAAVNSVRGSQVDWYLTPASTYSPVVGTNAVPKRSAPVIGWNDVA